MATSLALCFLLTQCQREQMMSEISSSKNLPQTVDFNFHIKPILSDRCFKCHGPDKSKQESELGLNNREGLYKELLKEKGRFVIVPGKPDESELYRRISSQDTDYQMPPPESNLSLTEYEIALIKKWIAQGAEYKEHWAFTPPVKPALPTVKNEDWAKNEIDFFILKTLQEN
ncbi:MAG: hypothetical protein KDD27_14035, partial [Saprospiraceae bacterium]|nr:hypothetical protein [Saprospiraceae bacterium]